MQILTMNKIDPAGLEVLEQQGFQVGDAMDAPEGLLLRSAKIHDMDFPASLLAVARAGAGTNNIPIDRCSEAGIVVFNTPGANANAVKELAIAAMLLASRNIIGGSDWVREQAAAGADVAAAVEKGKSAFVGPEIMGKTLGVVGLGAIGVLVANAAVALGMEVVGYDPYLSVETALRLDRHVRTVKDESILWKTSDYITLHLPYMPQTKDTVNAEVLEQMKDGVRVLNLARGELVNDGAMLAALERGKVACYVTGFPNSRIVTDPRVVAIPHLGASSPESERNCAVMAAQELVDYLENGNIRNSVNLPAAVMERGGAARVCVIHRNVPSVLASITTVLSQQGLNIENLTNKSAKEYAYTMVDVDGAVSPDTASALQNLENVIRVRVLP